MLLDQFWRSIPNDEQSSSDDGVFRRRISAAYIESRRLIQC